jgi:hypothetical protein
MSLSPEIIDAMVAAGCSLEQLATVIKTDLAAKERAAEDKRAKDADRKRRSRATRATKGHVRQRGVILWTA